MENPLGSANKIPVIDEFRIWELIFSLNSVPKPRYAFRVRLFG